MSQQNAHHVRTALTLTIAAISAPGFAQEPPSAWPSKPISVTVASNPGTGSDKEARMYWDKLVAVFGKPFVVTYKPGASGSIGADYVAKSAPDGYSFLAASTSFMVRPAFPPALPYDVVKDFAAVSMMSYSPIVLMAHGSFPPNNLAEYIAYGKANPGKILWATSGGGATNHLSGVLFHSLIGVEPTLIHYKGGGSNQQTDLLAGRTSVHPTSLQDMMPLVKSGKLKPIVVLNRNRIPLLPDVRTAHEQGLTDFEQPNFFGFMAPAGTNPVILRRVSSELAKVAKMPDIVRFLESEGAVAVGSTPEEFGKYIASGVARWTKVVRENNIQAN